MERHSFFVEEDPLGGDDPYSASKACSEIITASYWRSFFRGSGIGLATGEAGNVIGGGDWAQDRLIPDFLQALDSKSPCASGHRMPFGHGSMYWNR